MRLVKQVGHIDAMPYDLMIKTLDHIEIGIDGELDVVFWQRIQTGDIEPKNKI